MKLEFPEKKHEKEYVETIQEFADIQEKIIPGALGLKEGENYDDFLIRTKNNAEGINIKPGRVPSTLYFLIDDEGKIVGAEHIRHELNDALRFTSGHVGYGIRPSERKKGYVTIGLKLALEKCKELGLDKVLLTCDTDNIGSSKTIIKNGGVLDSEYEDEGVPSQRYWISIR